MPVSPVKAEELLHSLEVRKEDLVNDGRKFEMMKENGNAQSYCVKMPPGCQILRTKRSQATLSHYV